MGSLKMKGFRPRQGSFVEGDDVLLEEGGEEGGCGEAVEILSRHSPKSELAFASGHAGDRGDCHDFG
jgi:hypothetical protein